MNITLTLSDGATAHLQQLAKRQEDLRAQATRTLGNCVKEHLIRLNAQRPNALGGNRTNYYARAARATAINPQAGTVTIASRGFRYQLKGGTLRPSGRLSLLTGRPITRLAIPIHAKAHGKNPSDFGPLFLLQSKAENRAYLARTTGRGKAAKLELLFDLKASVTHKPDPTLLPDARTISQAIHTAFKKLLAVSR